MSAVYEVVEVARVRPNPNNIRQDLGDLEQLAGELKTLGVLSPLVVYPHPELEGDFMVKDGHRRLAAALKANLSNLPVVIVERSARGVLDDVETMLTTGRNHRALTALEEAKGFQTLLDLGQNESTIGKKFKRPKSEILTKARVATAPGKVQAAYAHGRIDLLTVKKLTDLEAAGQTGVLSKVLEDRDFDESRNYAISGLEHTIARAERDQAVDDAITRLAALGGVLRTDQRDENFEAADESLHEEEHIAAGHQFYVGADQDEPVWFVKLSKAKPTISDEEKQEKAKLRELNGGLQLSYKVRHQAVVAQIQSKEGVSEAADKELLIDLLMFDIMRLRDETLAELSGIDLPEDLPEWGKERNEWKDRVQAVLSKLTWRQLARAATYAKHQDTDRQLRFAKCFDRTTFEWSTRRRWLNQAQSHLGYRLDESERAALAFFKAKGLEREVYDPTTRTYSVDSEDVVILND